MDERVTAGNSNYNKMTVQYFKEVLYFVSSSVLADGSVLKNSNLLLIVNHYKHQN